MNYVEPRTFEFLSDFLLRVCEVCEEEGENVRMHWTSIEPVFICRDCFEHILEAALRSPRRKNKHVDIPEEENPLREL